MFLYACNFIFMRFSILLFLLWVSSALHAEWDQLFSDEEDPAIYHNINVITGNLNLYIDDGVIQGAKSLPLFRTYSSAGALESRHINTDLKMERNSWMMQGGWNFFPHVNLWIDLTVRLKHFKIYLAEPSGNLVSYAYSHEKNDHTLIFKPGKEFGQYTGALSAKHNISNYVLELNRKEGTALLKLPDGGWRLYKGHDLRHWDIIHWRRKRNEERSKYYYRLIKEVLPSRHEIHYFYDKKRHLVDVCVKNPGGTKTFASMHIDLIKKSSPFVLSIHTSDKKSLQYKTVAFKEVDYLCGMQCGHKPQERIGMGEARNGMGARMDWMDVANKTQFHIKYYAPSDEKQAKKWKEKPDKKAFEADKVRLLELPLGPSGEMVCFARFSYHPGRTDVRDSDNRLTRYHHTDGHLTSIEHYNEKEQCVSTIKFLWRDGRLKAKIMLENKDRAYFSKVFQYDSAGNVTQEILWGSLTGAIEGPFHLNDDGSLDGAEHYSKKYAYLPYFNVPILEEEENGLTYLYTYKQDTDLLTSKLTQYDGKIFLREFFIYDEDNLLIAEISDDGKTSDLEDLSTITQRHIKRYQRAPSSGRIENLTENYLDIATQTERQLKKVIYSYSPEGRVIAESVADANNVHRYTIITDYDAHGNITRKTTPLGQDNIYTYDNLNKVLTAKEAGSLQKKFYYDAAGRPAFVEESDSLGVVKRSCTTYDLQGNLTSQTDPKGNTTEQFYDGFGRCIQTRFSQALDSNGTCYQPSVTFEYDIQGNLSCTSVLGEGATRTTYNTLRKPLCILRSDGTTLCHRYSKNGPLLQTIQPDGTCIDYSYDSFQRMTLKRVYSFKGELLSTESWTYNTFHLLSYTDPNGLTTHYFYDGAGRKISEQAEAKVITYAYDALGFLEKTTETGCTHVQLHDVGGRIIEEWKELSDGHIENHMWFFYDEENRKTKAIRMTSVGEATDLFFYDRESRLTCHVDPLNQTTQFLYGEIENSLGQRVLEKTTIDPLGNRTIETHDAQNRVVNRSKADAQGNRVSQEALFYDKVGNQARRISTIYHGKIMHNSITVRWEYDSMGRIIAEREGSDKTTRFVYDIKGRLESRICPNGVSLNHVYDGLDRLVEMKSSDGTIHYQYAYGSGPDPTEVIDHIQHISLWRQYNVFGQIIKETNPYGLTCAWTYDHHQRPISYTLPDYSSVIYSYTAGHLTEVSRLSRRGELLYTHRYCAYNLNGQVEKEECIHSGIRLTTHDLLERPIQQQMPLFKQSIGYNPSGLVTMTGNTLFGSKTYAHDPLNQLTQEAGESHAFDSLGNPLDCCVNEYNQIVHGHNYHLEYDSNGNPIRRITIDGVTQYTYDALNRLTSITYPNAKQTCFVYDAFSRLIAQRKDNREHLYFYDKLQEVGKIDAQGMTLEFKVLDPQEKHPNAIAIEIAGYTYVPLSDFQGNTIALISSDQKIVEAYAIDSFGRENSATPLNPWRFASKRSFDGLVYFGQRFYDPDLKRWLTPDPSGFADGPNLYTYVLNSPLNRLDLFGLNSDLIFSRDLRIEVPLYLMLPAKVFHISEDFICRGFVGNAPVNWVVSCGHWHKLQFTPDEWKKGTVNIANHFQELVPHEGHTVGLLTPLNGILTNLDSVRQNVGATSKMIPEGTLTIALHNPTKGFFKDFIRFFKEKRGKDTPTVVRTRQFMVTVSERLYKINPELLWLHIPHSEGGVITLNAYKGMTPDQQDQLRHQLCLISLGPGGLIPSDYGVSVVNTYSKQDFITRLFALKYRNDPQYNIRFVPCRSSWSERTGYVADHAFLGGTYQNVLKDEIRDLRIKYGFYNSKLR